MANEDDASSSYPCGGDVGPSIPPRSISLGEVSEKIYQLQMELADRSFELENARRKLDMALVEGAYAARKVAQLRAFLDAAHQHIRRQEESHNLLTKWYSSAVLERNKLREELKRRD
ncbi:hypothetical protein LguiA_034006 [Lonicera macranthoides]